MKVLAMYLPQFHEVKENSTWWGEGFTDWVSASQALPLFEGHYQPHVPMGQNYYNLLNKDTFLWQARLMQQYGVDGVCMYHYWFKDGRKILEKPAENLLKWKDVQMPFCFCWANESWVRSWSGIKRGNVWSNLKEPVKKKGDMAILLEQKYGEQEQWKEHFGYLLPFFRDSRYIKVDGKPVFMIYKSQEIPCLEEMILYWKELALEAGLGGIYFIGSYSDSLVTSEMDAELIHEPCQSFREIIGFRAENRFFSIKYKDMWEHMLKVKPRGRKTYFGGFVGYDDTPRRGVEGAVIEDATPELFQYYLTELMAKNAAYNNDMVFLNAWNEWGEGMHLEPDEKFGTAFLEVISSAKKDYSKGMEKYIGNNVDDISDMLRIRQESDKFEKYLNLLDSWMVLREKGIKLDKYLLQKDYRRVGVYGYGIFGRHFIEELKDSDVELAYIVDMQKDKLHVDVPVYHPTEELPDCDVMVVTSFFYLNDIRKVLKSDNFKLLSIENIINEIGMF